MHIRARHTNERKYFQWRIQDFPEVGRQHTILPNFPKNGMKLKEFGSSGGDPPLTLHDLTCLSHLILYYIIVLIVFINMDE